MMPAPRRYLCLDTETGGLDASSHSLLSIGLVTGLDGQVEDSLEILVQHEPYVVTGGGMAVNRIDLATHHRAASPPEQVFQAMDDFLDRHFPKHESITLLGHNVAFDRQFLATFFARHQRPLEPRISHRLIDTHSLAAGLRDAGRLDLENLSSTALFDHFGIHVPPEKRHTALGDALATFELYWKLVERARSPRVLETGP